jgi:small subunit ribosomal protein S11
VKGIGIGREQAIRGLISGGIDIGAIFDITPVPHNGVKKKKVRKL